MFLLEGKKCGRKGEESMKKKKQKNKLFSHLNFLILHTKIGFLQLYSPDNLNEGGPLGKNVWEGV